MTFYPSMSLQFHEAVARAEAYEGERYLVLDGLSEVTTPDWINEERVRPILARGEWAADFVTGLLGIRRQRRAAALEQLAEWGFCDICSKNAIRRLCDEGIPSVDDALTAAGCPPQSREQRVAHLEEVIRLLETSKYRLALLDEQHAAVCRTFWLVKKEHAVLLETWRPTVQGRRVDVNIEIAEPAIIEAFRESFTRLWEQIPAENKEVPYVSAWLREQIDRLRQGHAGGARDSGN